MIYKCKMCKGDLQIIDEENGLCECEYCGSRQTVPLENNERKAELYNSANQYRKNNLFDRAADVYNTMQKRTGVWYCADMELSMWKIPELKK